MTATKTPFLHFELITDQAEKSFGMEPYVYVLKPTYQTDGSEKILVDNIQNGADYLNGYTKALLQFVRVEQFRDDPLRPNAWVYVSQRNVLNQTAQIEDWMKKVAANFPPSIPDPVTRHAASLLKIKWNSTDIKPVAPAT